jgi:hypothetical protein
MAKAEITVILPNMASLIQQEINKPLIPKTLQKAFNKARFQINETSLERSLFNHFKIDVSAGNDLPVATLRHGEQYALCADPCYLHADLDRLILFSDALDISEGEAEQLIAVIQPLLNDFGAKLYKYKADQWSIIFDEAARPDLTFTALADVKGKAVEKHLPNGDEPTRLDWLRLWNEIQMLLFDLPLNEQRQQQGKFPINSLWFWGKGDFQIQSNDWQLTLGNNELLKQLAKNSSTGHKLEVDMVEIVNTSGNQLIVFEPLDLEGDWLSQLDKIDQLINKLWSALKWNKLSKVNIEIPNFGHYQLTTFDCWKPWS